MTTSVGTALFARLTDAAFGADNLAVRNLIAKRVYPAQAVQDQPYPLGAYEESSGQRDQAHGGPSGLSRHEVTFACCGLTYDTAEALGRAVVDALDGEDGTWGGVRVRGCWVEEEADAVEAQVADTDKTIWRKDLQLLLWIAR